MTEHNQLITVDYSDSDIARIHMHDEEGKNALSEPFVNELCMHIQTIINNENIKVILLSGTPSVFCSGADIHTLHELTHGNLKPVDILLPKVILDIPIPVIAAMEGHATGGGLALGLCADIVILSEESRYGCSFMNMGFTPGMGTTKLLEQFMSPAIAHEILYTGKMKQGRELKEKSHINYILPKHDVLSHAYTIAFSIAEKNRNSLRLLKRYLSLEKRKYFEETFTIESLMHEISFAQPELQQNIRDNYVT